MFSIFKTEKKKQLLAGQATLAAGAEGVAWKLRLRGKQDVVAEDKASAFDGAGGISLLIKSGYEDKQFSYLRGQFTIEPDDCDGTIEFSLDLDVQNAPGVIVVVGLYDDAAYKQELKTLSQETQEGDGPQTLKFDVNFREIMARHKPAHGFIQVCLTPAKGASIEVGRLVLTQAKESANYRKLRIRYDFFGDVTKASSRLRVWKFVEILRQEGHDVFLAGATTDVDLYICQKNRPFNTLAAVRKANPRAVIVYDFDDNFLLPTEGALPEFMAFINYVDVVTCGSEYLAQTVRQWHSNVYVLENPLDVDSDALCRTPNGSPALIGWFGSPEGLQELKKVSAGVPVTTLTKGGDIEFDIRTVDRQLTTFDLLLFPVEETQWNLAKNANRMMKAVALGVPVLGNATPEQSRIASLIGLPGESIQPTLEGWDRAIENIRNRFQEIEQETLQAREKLWESHSTRAILTKLFDHIVSTTRLGQGLASHARTSSSDLKDVAVLVVDGSALVHINATFSASAVDWASFHSVTALSTKNLSNEFLQYDMKRVRAGGGEYLSVFGQADAVIESCEAEYILVIPSGATLAHGIVAIISELVRDKAQPLALFARSAYCSPVTIGKLGAYPVQDLLENVAPIGPLLARTDWLKSQKIRWSQTFEFWTWVVAMKALTNSVPMALIDLPFAYDVAERGDRSVARQYASWLTENRPAAARELPDISKQWARLLTDIIADATSTAAADLPVAFADLYARHLVASRRLNTVERELRALKAKKPA